MTVSVLVISLMNDALPLLVGALIIVPFVFVNGFQRGSRTSSGARTLSPTFARVYGLLSIAILAVLLVKTTTDEKILTGVFTLFGTIGGYLAGARVVDVPSDATSGSGETGEKHDNGKEGSKLRTPERLTELG